MPFSYDDPNTGLFTHLGELASQFHRFQLDARHSLSGLDADRKEIQGAFGAGDSDVAVKDLTKAYTRWKAQYAARRGALAAAALRRLEDRATVTALRASSTDDGADILSHLIDSMNRDGVSIKRSNLEFGLLTSNFLGWGGGTILPTGMLDRVTSPGVINTAKLRPHLAYKGVQSQLCVPSETWSFSVPENATGAEEEQLVWVGWPAGEPFGLEEGSGYVGTLKPIQASGLISNGDFEAFSGNSPTDWTVDSGVVGTNIFKETETALIFNGVSALKMAGSGVATISISQAISPSSLLPGRGYCVTARVVPWTPVTNGDLLIQFEGTGYVASATEAISMPAASLSSSVWLLKHFFIVMPDTIPSDFRLVVKWQNTPTTGQSIYIDDVAVGPVNYGAGGGAVAVRGVSKFAAGDQFEIPVTNVEGQFQSFFRQAFGVQLPSSDTPTIDDSLARAVEAAPVISRVGAFVTDTDTEIQTIDAGADVGDLLLLFVCSGASGLVYTIFPPSGWTGGGGYIPNCAAFYKIADGINDTPLVTTNVPSPTDLMAVIIALKGYDPLSPVPTTGGNWQTPVIDGVLGAILPPVANTRLITAVALDSDGIAAGPSGYGLVTQGAIGAMSVAIYQKVSPTDAAQGGEHFYLVNGAGNASSVTLVVAPEPA